MSARYIMFTTDSHSGDCYWSFSSKKIVLSMLIVRESTLQDDSLILPPAISYSCMSPSRARAMMGIP